MAKPKKTLTKYSIDAALDKNTPPMNEDVLYANHARIQLSTQEMILDLFQVTTTFKEDAIQTKHMQRVIMPVTLIKGLASAIVNTIARFEQESDWPIPNNRLPQEMDIYDLWKILDSQQEKLTPSEEDTPEKPDQ